MAEKTSDETLAQIKKLIEEEKKEALDFFRRSNFTSQLRTRLKEEKSYSSSFIYWQKKRALLISTALVLIIVALIIWLSLPRPKGVETEWAALKDFLEQRLSLSNSPPLPEPTSSSEPKISSLSQVIATTLNLALTQSCPLQEEAFSWPSKKKVKSSELEKKIIQLFREGAIEKFLLNCLKESKEVSDASPDAFFRICWFVFA